MSYIIRLLLFAVAIALVWSLQSNNSKSPHQSLPNRTEREHVKIDSFGKNKQESPPFQIVSDVSLPNIDKETEKIQSHESLSHFQKKFFDEIPKKYHLKNLSEGETHHNSPLVLESGQWIAEAREFFVMNRVSAYEQTMFYLRCATQSDLLESTRALCAARAQQQFQIYTGRTMSRKIFEPRIAYLSSLVNLN